MQLFQVVVFFRSLTRIPATSLIDLTIEQRFVIQNLNSYASEFSELLRSNHKNQKNTIPWRWRGKSAMLPLFDAKRNTAISFALRTTGNMPYAALEGIPQLNAMDYARYALSLPSLSWR